MGSVALGRQLEAELRARGLNPYVIAVGGSTPLGARAPCSRTLLSRCV